jgi:general secretion pathway protein E
LLTNKLQHLINSRAHPVEMHRQAIADGYLPMREYGFQKVLAGETTLEEVLAVTATDRSAQDMDTMMPRSLAAVG